MTETLSDTSAQHSTEAKATSHQNQKPETRNQKPETRNQSENQNISQIRSSLPSSIFPQTQPSKPEKAGRADFALLISCCQKNFAARAAPSSPFFAFSLG
jgi:hypothetical protein